NGDILHEALAAKFYTKTKNNVRIWAFLDKDTGTVLYIKRTGANFELEYFVESGDGKYDCTEIKKFLEEAARFIYSGRTKQRLNKKKEQKEVTAGNLISGVIEAKKIYDDKKKALSAFLGK